MERSTAEADKARLRRRYAGVRDRLPGDERLRLSAELAEAVIAGALEPLADGLGRPLAVGLYGAFRSEADPSPVAAWCWSHGHRVLAPRIEEAGGMSLRELASPADWKTGRWGVPEPDPERTLAADIGGELDVVLVPGLAFDSYGGRLGYGGGYYDRLNAARLAATAGGGPRSGEKKLRTRWIGYGFEAQRAADALPAEPHDLRLDGLATERGLIWLNGGGQVMDAGVGREAERDGLTHFNEQGRAVMVDVSDKAATARVACAETRVKMRPETLRRIAERSVAKGDVLAIAQVAGIQAAKRTADWIPLCHPLPLTGVDIRFADNGFDTLIIEAEVKTTGKTGVEMEALTAVSAAALTVYDMCKALQKDMEIGPTLLLAKTGGKSGDYARRERATDGAAAADAD